MALFYANENFPLPTVLELRHLGHDVLTVAEAGGAGIQMTAEEVLTFATENTRAVITLNRRHFIALYQQQPEHAGIVACTVDPDFAALARHVHEALVPYHDDLSGHLIRITRRA